MSLESCDLQPTFQIEVKFSKNLIADQGHLKSQKSYFYVFQEAMNRVLQQKSHPYEAITKVIKS